MTPENAANTGGFPYSRDKASIVVPMCRRAAKGMRMKKRESWKADGTPEQQKARDANGAKSAQEAGAGSGRDQGVSRRQGNPRSDSRHSRLTPKRVAGAVLAQVGVALFVWLWWLGLSWGIKYLNALSHSPAISGVFAHLLLLATYIVLILSFLSALLCILLINLSFILRLLNKKS